MRRKITIPQLSPHTCIHEKVEEGPSGRHRDARWQMADGKWRMARGKWSVSYNECGSPDGGGRLPDGGGPARDESGGCDEERNSSPLPEPGPDRVARLVTLS